MPGSGELDMLDFQSRTQVQSSIDRHHRLTNGRSATRCVVASLAILAFVGPVSSAWAIDPTGTWRSNIQFNNQTLAGTLKLRPDSEGSHLTGSARRGLQGLSDPIKNGRYHDGSISFSVSHDSPQQTLKIAYSGVVKGDTIVGRCQIAHGDQVQSSDWIAKRQSKA